MSSTRGRTLWEATVDNAELMAVIVETARASLSHVHWPAELPSSAARELCHAYVQGHTWYTAEDADQYVRTPRAFINDGGGDCKSTAIFIGTMCRAAGWPVVLRFVQWPGADHFGHVYPVVGGVAADPLLPLGEEALYLRHQDFHL